MKNPNNPAADPANAGGSDPANPANPANPENNPANARDWRAELVTALKLSPGEGETEVSDDAILAALSGLVASAEGAVQLTTDLDAARRDLESVRGEYDALMQREREAAQRLAEAEADTILETYATRIKTPEARARMRTLLLNDKDAAIEILNGLPEVPAQAAAPANPTPPDPMHDPEAAAAAAGDQDRAKKVGDLARKLQAEGKASNWADAWAMAEKQIG